MQLKMRVLLFCWSFLFGLNLAAAAERFPQQPPFEREFFELPAEASQEDLLRAMQVLASQLRFQDELIPQLAPVAGCKVVLEEVVQNGHEKLLYIAASQDSHYKVLVNLLPVISMQDREGYRTKITEMHQRIQTMVKDFRRRVTSVDDMQEFFRFKDKFTTEVSLHLTSDQSQLAAVNRAYWDHSLEFFTIVLSTYTQHLKEIRNSIQDLVPFKKTIDTLISSDPFYSDLTDPISNVFKMGMILKNGWRMTSTDEYLSEVAKIFGLAQSITQSYATIREQALDLYEQVVAQLRSECLAYGRKTRTIKIITDTFLVDRYSKDRLPETLREHPKVSAPTQVLHAPVAKKPAPNAPAKSAKKKKKSGAKKKKKKKNKSDNVVPSVLLDDLDSADEDDDRATADTAAEVVVQPPVAEEFRVSESVAVEESQPVERACTAAPTRTVVELVVSEPVAAPVSASPQPKAVKSTCLQSVYRQLLTQILQALQVQLDRYSTLNNCFAAGKKPSRALLQEKLLMTGMPEQSLLAAHHCVWPLRDLIAELHGYQLPAKGGDTTRKGNQPVIALMEAFNQCQPALLLLMNALTLNLGALKLRPDFLHEYNGDNAWFEEDSNFYRIHDIDNYMVIGVAKPLFQRNAPCIVTMVPPVSPEFVTKEYNEWYCDAEPIAVRKGYPDRIVATRQHRFSPLVDTLMATVGSEYCLIQDIAMRPLIKKKIVSPRQKNQLLRPFLDKGLKIVVLISFDGYVEFSETGERRPCCFEYLFDERRIPQWFHREIRFV